MHEAPLLLVDHLTIARGGRTVVHGRSLRVDVGEIVGLVGANGCGKSTLLACIAGVLAPKDGRVEIAGASVWGSSSQRQRARAQMGFVPEAADPPGFLRAEELWALCAVSRGGMSRGARGGVTVPDEALRAAMGLDEIATLSLDRMSLGQRRRACLGAALIGAPRLLVLDEPDNGLDVTRLGALVPLVRNHAATGGATILASHDAAWLDELGARRIALA